jgi:hypothetical protein
MDMPQVCTLFATNAKGQMLEQAMEEGSFFCWG